jgi:hypothetical protein
MRIETTPLPKPTPEFSNPAWNSFFSHFSQELTSYEKKQMIEFFTQQLSHAIHHQMQRMIEAYKKMKEDQNS